MIFPRWISKGDVIGVTAPSDGVKNELDIVRFKNGSKMLEEKGNPVLFTDNVFKTIENGASDTGRNRGMYFNELVNNEKVSAIYSAKGGTYLAEMLPYVDYDAFVAHPKWVQGYSDNTGLLFTLTTKYDVATAYGCNFSDYGMEVWDDSVMQNYNLLRGQSDTVHSFPMYQDGFGPERETGLEGYYLEKKSCWENGRGEEEIEMTGRLIGGCSDVLFFLNSTRYDGTLDFIEKYKEDGIIWYLETFASNSDELLMHLWQLKELGWFKYAKGFIFGRPLMYQAYNGKSYAETVMYMLGDLNVPMIFNADIGHKGPQMTMINGAIATIRSAGGKGSVRYRFE